jgi:MOSC domain-containing protein YiiM
MTTADQLGLDKDPRIVGTLARERGAYLGRYARVLRPGTIRAGDPIVCLGVGEAVDLDLFAFYRDRIRG